MLEPHETPSPLKRQPSGKMFLLTEKTKKMGYCDIPKSASSTLRSTSCIMNSIDAVTESKQPECYHRLYKDHSLLATNTKELSQLNNLNIFKFMFVRHPFERLASAYNDKFVAHTKNYTYKSRADGTKVTVEEAYITHIRDYQKKFMNMASVDTCLDESSLEFKFSCFVEYVLDSTRNEEKMANVFGQYMVIHWWPYTEMCRVCKIHYDFIGHIEDFQSDIQMLLAKFPDNKALKELYKRKKKMNCTSNCDEKKNDVYLKYFRQLSKRVILRLYHMYKNDFELGGYDFPEKYIAAGIDDKK